MIEPGASLLDPVAEGSVEASANPALCESDARYRQLADCLPAAVYMCDAAGRVTLFNRAAAELWGREPALGQDSWYGSWKIFQPDGQPLPLDQCPLAVALREGRSVAGQEIIVERPDGTRRHVMPHPEPLRDSAGTVVGAVDMLIDVTDQRQAKAAQALLAAIVESSSDAILSLSTEGQITSWNAGAERLFGYSAEEVIGQNICLMVPADCAEAEQRVLERVERGERVRHYDSSRLRKDGARIDISVTASPIRNKLGRIIGISKVCRSIAARKWAESALRDSEDRFRTFAKNAPVAIFTKDLAGRYTQANPLACEALGRPEGVVGLTDHDLLPVEVADQLRERDLEVISTGVAGERMEVVGHEGSRRDFLSLKFPLFDTEGRIVGVCGVATDITERKRDQEALRVSEERFSQFMQHLPGLAWIKDADGRYMFANDAASKAFQIAVADLFGKTDAEVFGAETAEQFRRNDAQALASESGIQTVETLEQGDGMVHYSLVSKFPIPSLEGRPALVGGMAIDITDQKQAEAALRKSEERFRTLASHAPVGIFMTEQGGGTVFVNESWCEMTGLSPDEACGNGWVNALHPDDRARVTADWQRAVRDCAASEAEYRFLRPDGAVTWLQGNAVPIRDASGQASGYIGTVMDITERKRAEEALRTSEQLYRAIGESNDYGVWVCDLAGRNVYASESFLKLVGLSQAECSDLGWTTVLHPDELEETTRDWQECVRTGGTWDREHRFRGVDGKWHTVLARGVPVRNQAGEITAWAGINLDISRLKRVEDELREADRRKDEFLAILAHELRNPLAPIRTGLELMKLAGDDHALVEDVRTTMERQAQQMVRLIDDLLDVSRITRDAVELRKCRVDLASVVQNAVDTARPAIDEAGHRLQIALPKQSIVLDADSTRLSQVISNLLNNAAKYMSPGGLIELSAQRRDRTVVIAVKDSGIGIPPEMLDRIFDMFTQVARSREHSTSGLGIGLTLVKRLVEMHDGTIEARSAGPGQGSEFVIELPLVVAPLSRSQDAGGAAVASPGKRRILVADDNEHAARMLAMLLTALGNDVRVAVDGQDALEAAEEFVPDIVLLDLGMPRLDGYETAREIRRRPWGQGMVLAALTGWGQEEDKRRTKEAGFNHHFVKPVELSTLEQLLSD